MPRKTQPTRRKPRSPVDPTGRLDVLAAKLAERVVVNARNPVLSAVYDELAGDLQTVLSEYLGPRNRKLARVTRIVRGAVLNSKTPSPFPSRPPRLLGAARV